MPILDPEDDHVPIPHRIEEFYQRMGDGENWKQIGMFMVTNMGGCLCDVDSWNTNYPFWLSKYCTCAS